MVFEETGVIRISFVQFLDYMPVVCKRRVMSCEVELRGGAKSSKYVLTATPSNATGCQPAIPKLAGTGIRFHRESASEGCWDFLETV